MVYTTPTDLRQMSDDQIWDIIFDAQTESDAYQRAVLMLQMRLAEGQTTASAANAESTKDLARFTCALVKATWALFFVGGAAVLLTLVQVLIATGVIRQ